jgi:hypothetical protein
MGAHMNICNIRNFKFIASLGLGLSIFEEQAVMTNVSMETIYF